MTQPAAETSTTPATPAGDTGQAPDVDPATATRATIAEAHRAAHAAVDQLPGLDHHQRQQLRATIDHRAQVGLPQPLPPVREDPALATAAQLNAAYAAQAEAIRTDPNLSDLAKAEQLDQAHRDLDAQLLAQWQDLQARRAARLQTIESMTLPYGDPGPDVAAASPADRVVLLAAFKQAYEQAKTVDQDTRRKMVDDADRWGDHVARRAILTAADHVGDQDTVRDWVRTHRPHQVGIVDERIDLRTKLAGHDLSTDWSWTRQAFRMPPPPRERGDLDRLREEQRQREYHLRQREREQQAVWNARGPR